MLPGSYQRRKFLWPIWSMILRHWAPLALLPPCGLTLRPTSFARGVVAAVGDDLVVGGGVFLVGAAEQQVRTTARGGVVDEAFEAVRVVERELATPERNDFQPALFHFGADGGGFVGCRCRREDQVVLALGGHQPHVLEPGGGDAVERDTVIVLCPWPGVTADLPARRWGCGRGGKAARQHGGARCGKRGADELSSCLHDQAVLISRFVGS